MQVQAKMPVFDELSCILAQADSLTNPAEIHGILCGLICAGRKLDGQFWLHTAFRLIEARAHFPSSQRDRIIELYDSICRQLSGLDGEFQILLPNEAQPILERAASLTQWCYGFLYGLAFVDSAIMEIFAEESRDVLHSISEIAKLDYANIEVSDMDISAYLNVAEFVRSSIVRLYNEFVVKTTESLH
jgi:hypothetical protein